MQNTLDRKPCGYDVGVVRNTFEVIGKHFVAEERVYAQGCVTALSVCWHRRTDAQRLQRQRVTSAESAVMPLIVSAAGVDSQTGLPSSTVAVAREHLAKPA